MSNYNGRHGPNVSQYLRDLNTISPGDTTGLEEPYVVEDDLAIFTNTQFFDIDSGRNTDFQAQAQPVKTEGKALHSGTASEDVSAAASVIGEMPNLDFMSGEFWHLVCTSALSAGVLSVSSPVSHFPHSVSSPSFLQRHQTPVSSSCSNPRT